MTEARWIVEGYLEAVSPIALMTGFEEAEWDEAGPRKEPNEYAVATEKKLGDLPLRAIELDASSLPYLPATAIKGVLRSIAASGLVGVSSEQLKSLFGNFPQEDNTLAEASMKVAQGGILNFLNAYLPNGAQTEWRPALRGRTAIFEGSRTAEDGQLRHERIVAPGTRFFTRVIVESGTQEDVGLLLGLLDLLDGRDAWSALGSSTSHGGGKVAWSVSKVARFGGQEAKSWLETANEDGWENFASRQDVTPRALARMSEFRIKLPLELQIGGNFLSSANETYTNENGDSATRLRPIRYVGGDETTALLPGSSLNGALRAQAQRIYRTIGQDFAAWEEDDMGLPPAIENLFGSHRHRSLLECETFCAEDLEMVQQEFVAIDRFSGGAADEKKFAVRSFEAPNLKGEISIVTRRFFDRDLSGLSTHADEVELSPEAVGLLALVLKDLASGDVPLGYGTRKGYGAVTSATSSGKGWKNLLEDLGSKTLELAQEVGSLSVLADCENGTEAIETSVSLLRVEAENWSRAEVQPQEMSEEGA